MEETQPHGPTECPTRSAPGWRTLLGLYTDISSRSAPARRRLKVLGGCRPPGVSQGGTTRVYQWPATGGTRGYRWVVLGSANAIATQICQIYQWYAKIDASHHQRDGPLCTSGEAACKLGQTIFLQPTIGNRGAASGAYEVTKQLPERGGEFEYRIKSSLDPHERAVRESELGLEGRAISGSHRAKPLKNHRIGRGQSHFGPPLCASQGSG